MKITLTDPRTTVTLQPRNFTVTLSGARGPAGQGLPAGGTEGQIIVKQSATDYDTAWADNYATNVELYVKNSTAGAMTKGQVVYVSGADGTNPTVTLAQATSEGGSSKTIGVLKQDLAIGASGYVITDGLLEGLNTNSAGAAGDTIWLSPTTAGGVVYGDANKPSAPNHLVFIGYVLRKNTNNGKIFVKIQNGFELQELHNVAISNPVTGQVLKYNGTTGLWSNDTDAGGINTLNGLTASTQTFATGTSGTDFAISSSTSTHTFNIPTASASARGLLSSSDWSSFNSKQGALTLTTTGSSGAATLVGNTLNIPQYSGSTISLTTTGTSGAATLVGSTLNIPQYQSALTNPVTGTGTSGQVSYFNGTSAVTGKSTFIFNTATDSLRIDGGVGINRDRSGVRAIDVLGGGIRLTGSTGGTFEVNASNSNFNVSTVSGQIGVAITDTSTARLSMQAGVGNNWEIQSSTTQLRIRDITNSNTDRLVLATNGNFTIGHNADLSARLAIRGSGTTSATTALLVQNGTPSELFKVLDNGSTTLGLAQTFTTGNLQYSHLNINGDFTVNTSANNSVIGSINSQLITEGTASIGNGRLISAIFNNRNTSTGNIIRAGYFSSRTSSSGAGNTFIGLTGDVVLDGSGNIGNVSAIEAGISKSNTSIITNAYGVKINNLANTGGTITNTYGIYIGDITAGTQTNTPYAIYSEDASAVSYLAGSTSIGTTSASARLHVRGSGTTSSTTALLVQNGTPTDLFVVRDDGIVRARGSYLNLGTDQNVAIGPTTTGTAFNSGGADLLFSGSNIGSTNACAYFSIYGGNKTATSGIQGAFSLVNGNFAPTSGTAQFRCIDITSNLTINQTGGANGITRGLYVNPTLTAAADWRGIESVAASNANHTLLKLRNATVDVFTVKADSKIGFWNATPVAQPTTAIAEATFTENSGGTAVNVDSTFAGYTLQQIAQALKDIGILQ